MAYRVGVSLSLKDPMYSHGPNKDFKTIRDARRYAYKDIQNEGYGTRWVGTRHMIAMIYGDPKTTEYLLGRVYKDNGITVYEAFIKGTRYKERNVYRLNKDGSLGSLLYKRKVENIHHDDWTRKWNVD